ncbi:MAG: MlaD family protein [Treponema sp.]|jgi:phospholipid/cholesterol/gamma-HCH transport system substrate-binding protein|nr:MlaD family protein [Treponema sp.]
MKLSIRYADKIVGLLIIAALGILVFVIFMLGSSQRWFTRDLTYVSYFNSASGLGQNMAIQYKGFSIGNVKSVKFDKDYRVEVRFIIFSEYKDLVTNGSLVEVIASPLAALGGNSFNFYPGAGTELLSEGDTIPIVNSAEGRRLVALGLASLPDQEDGISAIMSSVGVLLGNLNDITGDLAEAFEGTDRTSLGRLLGGAEGTLAGLESMAKELPADIVGMLNNIVVDLEPILANLQVITTKAADSDETIMTILDSDGPIYKDLVETLNALSGTIRNLEKTTDILPAQLAVLLAGLNATLKTAEDVLIAVTNNPLLRRGVPAPREINAGGAHIRDIEF